MTTPPQDDAPQAYTDVLARIARAAQAVGRDPATVTLVAVSKTQPWEAVAPVLAAGQTVFGENRVQEAMARWEGKTGGLTLHLIGPLQTNKAREATTFFDVIETLVLGFVGQCPGQLFAIQGLDHIEKGRRLARLVGL